MKAIILARMSTEEQKILKGKIDILVYKLYSLTPKEIKIVESEK